MLFEMTPGLTPYLDAQAIMDAHVDGVLSGEACERIWFLEHPSIYTAGTSAQTQDCLRMDVPTFQTGRGGQYTYHGPGQLIIYCMVDLRERVRDVRLYVHTLEQWVMDAFRVYGVIVHRRADRVGLWHIDARGNENKIVALGVRIRKWVTSHGIAININPDLSYFEGIVPCGIRGHGVTSLHAQGYPIPQKELIETLQELCPF